MVDATYFLNLGHDAPVNVPMNQMDPRLSYEHKALLNQSVPNPFYQVLTPDKFPGQLRNQRTVAVSRLLVPYPQYGNLTLNNGQPGASTRYQAFQLQLQRPFVNGFNFIMGYNYNRGRSKEFYDDLDTFDRNLTWQDTNFPRQKFTLAGIYNLPFGRGRTFLRDAHRAVDAVLGGWGISGILTHNTGDFLRFGAMDLNGDPCSGEFGGRLRFNTTVFSRIQPFTRRSNPWQFGCATGPSFRNLDLTASKEFSITERVKFELRMEAYNATNSFMGANPSMDVNSSLFGRVVNQRAGYYGRQFQYSGRFRW